MKTENIKVTGHKGTWYLIDTGYYRGRKVYLLEHEEYGDEAPCIIIDAKGNLILEDVYNGLGDLEN